MNYLLISDRGKAIPYPPAERPDGQKNHGFRSLKGRPEAVADIPECAESAALRSLLLEVNDAKTGVFTVGCLCAPVEEEQGFRRTGYVEFALNSHAGVADAQNYFPCFFWFDRLWKQEAQGSSNQHHWELKPAGFLDAGVSGFSCAVTINTGWYPSQVAADESWDHSINLLARLLREVPPATDSALIY